MSEANNPAMPRALMRFWILTVALTVLSVAFTLWMTHTMHSRHLWGLAFMWGRDAGYDFHLFQKRFLHFGEPGLWDIPDFPLTYPALAGVAFGLLFKLAHPLRDFIAFSALAVAAWVAWLVRALATEGVRTDWATGFVITFTVCCWPLWFLFDTGNIEGLAIIALSLGLLAFIRHRWAWAAALIGIAGALKVFPLIVLALLLSRRRYWEFAGGMALAAALTIGSLALLGPSIGEAQRHINEGFALNLHMYALTVTPWSVDAHHSFYGMLKYVVILAHHRHLYEPTLGDPVAIAAQMRADVAMLKPALWAYEAAAAIFGVTAYFLRIRRMPMLNQIFILTLCAVTLPPLSMDYTLVHLLVPFGLFCVFAAHRARLREETPGLALCLICMAFVFTAGTYFSLRYRLTCEVRTLALLLLLMALLRYPFVWPELDADAVSSHA